MVIARRFSPHRRELVVAGLAAFTAGSATSARRLTPVVTMLGDSLTAGYGLAAADALPAQLQAALRREGSPARVRAAGVSGDTTADGLARADFSVRPDTTLCLVALGGNDLLQGIDPKVTRENLRRIVRRLKGRGIGVLLAGLTAPPVIGAAYARAFDAVFPAVARQEGVELYPDLLAGVIGHAGLMQNDGLHPNAAGARLIAARLAPAVERALRQTAAR